MIAKETNVIVINNNNINSNNNISYKYNHFEFIIFECAQTKVYPHVNVRFVHCFVSKIVLLVNSHSN